MSKNKIKKQIPSPALRPERLEIQNVTEDKSEYSLLKTQALVWGIHKGHERKLLGYVIRTSSCFPEAVAGQPLWQYRHAQTAVTLVESHAGFAHLVTLIARHHGVKSRAEAKLPQPPREEGSRTIHSWIHGPGLRVDEDLLVGIQTIPGAGSIKVQILPGIFAFYDPQPLHWRTVGDSRSFWQVLDGLGKDKRRKLEAALQDYNLQRIERIARANGGPTGPNAETTKHREEGPSHAL